MWIYVRMVERTGEILIIEVSRSEDWFYIIHHDLCELVDYSFLPDVLKFTTEIGNFL